MYGGSVNLFLTRCVRLIQTSVSCVSFDILHTEYKSKKHLRY